MKKRIRSDVILKILMVLLDFFIFQVALTLAYLFWVRLPWHGNWQFFTEFSMLMYVVPPLTILVFAAVGLYKPEMGIIGVQEQSLIFKAIWIIYVIIFGFQFFYRDIQFSRLATLYSMGLAILLISIERHYMRVFQRWLSRHGIWIRHALIYGAGFHGVRLERWIQHSPQLGIKVHGFIDDQPETLMKKPKEPPIVGGFSQLARWVKKNDTSILFIAHRNLEEAKVIKIVQKCRNLGIRTWVIPSLYRLHVERVEVQNIGGIPLLGFKDRFGRQSYELVKNILDRLFAIILSIFLCPLGFFVALGIMNTSGRPIFFKQARVGRNRKKFMIYKFRTLKKGFGRHKVSPELGKSKSKGMTGFGRFLRKTGFDEIPQLINVIRGEMSLVGPRPEMPFLVSKYGSLEKERLTVKPGITGLWQISDDRKRLLIHENMDYDLYYVENMSFNLDLAILVRTASAVWKRVFS